MTITTIQVQGYHIAIEMSCSVPQSEWELFKRDLIDSILDGMDNNETSGTVDMYYIEGGNDTDDEGYEIDVDIKWNVINWKEIADKLYQAWVTQEPGVFKEAKEEYEKYNSYYGTE